MKTHRNPFLSNLFHFLTRQKVHGAFELFFLTSICVTGKLRTYSLTHPFTKQSANTCHLQHIGLYVGESKLIRTQHPIAPTMYDTSLLEMDRKSKQARQ